MEVAAQGFRFWFGGSWFGIGFNAQGLGLGLPGHHILQWRASPGFVQGKAR